MCACQGGCVDQLWKLTFPKGNSTYASNIANGRALCTHCNYWVGWKFCHLKNNVPAKSDSLGKFCNCCGFRVRQLPKSKRSKEILNQDQNDSREQLDSPTRTKIQKNTQKKKSQLVLSEQKQKTRKDRKWDIEKIYPEKTLDEFYELLEVRFSDNPSLLKQLQRLEKYLTLLPNNKKYQNVKFFLN